jgi:16S rRNA (adenine1518-N6/adenine1519-N6)-dimethyltransferase
VASSSAEPRPSPNWRERLAALGLRPSKGLGQNFLHDINVVRRIVAVADPRPEETVLEIGPGLGILTEELAHAARRVVAVEIDRRLVALLREQMPDNVTVVEADALTIDPAALAGPDYSVVANLPYSVGNAIVRRLQEAEPPPRSLTVMLQREVAERMSAAPPEMSILSVAVQFYGTPRVVFRVGGGAFVPPPNVESAVVRIDTRIPPLPSDEHERFFRVVTAGFGQRRKQLVNTLSGGLALPRSTVATALEAAGIAPTERAERLTVDDWVRLYQHLMGAESNAACSPDT